MAVVAMLCLHSSIQTSFVLQCVSHLIIVKPVTGMHGQCHPLHFSFYPNPWSNAEQPVSTKVCLNAACGRKHTRNSITLNLSLSEPRKQWLHNYQQLQSKLTSTVTEISFVSYGAFEMCKDLFVFSLGLRSSHPGALQSIYRNKP